MKKEPPTPQKSVGPPLENLTKVIFVVLGALFSLILLVFTIRLLLWSQWTVDPPSSTVQGRKFRDPRMKNMFLVLPSVLKTSGDLLRTKFGTLEKSDFCGVGGSFFIDFTCLLLYKRIANTCKFRVFEKRVAVGKSTVLGAHWELGAHIRTVTPGKHSPNAHQTALQSDSRRKS